MSVKRIMLSGRFNETVRFESEDGEILFVVTKSSTENLGKGRIEWSSVEIYIRPQTITIESEYEFRNLFDGVMHEAKSMEEEHPTGEENRS